MPSILGKQTTKALNINIEAEVTPGLEEISAVEIIKVLGEKAVSRLRIKSNAIQFRFTGPLENLQRLKTVIAVYILRYFDVPRPKALLGHQNFQLLVSDIQGAFQVSDRQQFQTLYLSAAGADSSVMLRLKQEIARHTGLTVSEATGDLWIRVRKAQNGWDVLTRLTPRPSVTREWRVCNMEGALNAAVASAMIQLAAPQSDEVVLNLMCGTGTLMIECAEINSNTIIIGCDIDAAVLECAKQNLKAAHLDNKLSLVHGDAQKLPLSNGIADIICADLPFGQLVGSHEENQQLYPQFLSEAWRLSHSGTRCILITHEVRLIESLLAKSNHWQLEKTYKITLRGLHPRIYLLHKP